MKKKKLANVEYHYKGQTVIVHFKEMDGVAYAAINAALFDGIERELTWARLDMVNKMLGCNIKAP